LLCVGMKSREREVIMAGRATNAKRDGKKPSTRLQSTPKHV